jgi:hypothetical protein
VDKDGKNVLETTRPKEFDELAKLLHPRGEQVILPDEAGIGVAGHGCSPRPGMQVRAARWHQMVTGGGGCRVSRRD